MNGYNILASPKAGMERPSRRSIQHYTSFVSLNSGHLKDGRAELQTVDKSARSKLEKTASRNSPLANGSSSLSRIAPPSALAPSLMGSAASVLEYPYEAIVAATDNFSAERLLGKGTFGTVYSGSLYGTDVAVKVLHSAKETGFEEEMIALSKFRHPNLVILMGHSHFHESRFLVFEMLSGKDLQNALLDGKLHWRQRVRILADAAVAISYLHNTKPKCYHRDIKTANIMISSDGVAKVGDFGLSCLVRSEQRGVETESLSGTIGYADPEYMQSGVTNEATETYSFGIVILETLTSYPPAVRSSDGKFSLLASYMESSMEKLLPLVDPTGKFPPSAARRLGLLAFRCIDPVACNRASFTEIIEELRSLQAINDQPVKLASPTISNKWREFDERFKQSLEDSRGSSIKKLSTNGSKMFFKQKSTVSSLMHDSSKIIDSPSRMLKRSDRKNLDYWDTFTRNSEAHNDSFYVTKGLNKKYSNASDGTITSRRKSPIESIHRLTEPSGLNDTMHRNFELNPLGSFSIPNDTYYSDRGNPASDWETTDRDAMFSIFDTPDSKYEFTLDASMDSSYLRLFEEFTKRMKAEKERAELQRQLERERDAAHSAFSKRRVQSFYHCSTT